MISQVKHVNIPITDPDRSIAFFTEKLGFTVTTDAPFGPGRRWIELSLPGGSTKVTLFTPEGHEARIGTFSGIVFEARDIEATYREMVEKGVEFAQPLEQESWGTSAVFKDPDGNTFVLSTET
jgi:catechol 2,3-dioxygenase-like lactoylglutathione lyase family enzyme